MIVDLVGNDLGRVCRPGTVRVTALAELRPHAGVLHLVSEVEGELRGDVGNADLIRAAFPPGSVTGAPKLAALVRHRRARDHRARGLHGRQSGFA